MSLLAKLSCFVGTLYLCYLSWKILKFLVELIKTTFGRSVDFKRFGDWAVVTGCTNGIGKEYAKQLAAKGLNIVLMSRSKEKLDAVALEIENDHKVRTKVIQVDFSRGHEIYEAIGKELEGLEIGVLVNNVGVTLSCPEFIHNISPETLGSHVNVNCMAVVMVTRMIIPSMVERKKGIIINLSSVSAVLPISFLGVYPAAKAFMDNFSESLQIEYADKGIIIQSVLPGLVMTNMSSPFVRKAKLTVPLPSDYVRCMLKKVGVAKRSFGYWPHELQALWLKTVFQVLPDCLSHKFTKKKSLKIRARIMRKKNEKKESKKFPTLNGSQHKED